MPIVVIPKTITQIPGGRTAAMDLVGNEEEVESVRDLYSDAISAIHREYEEFRDRGVLPISTITGDAVDRVLCIRRMLSSSWQTGSVETYRAMAALFEAWDDRDQWLVACRYEARAKEESSPSLASSSSSAAVTTPNPIQKLGPCIVSIGCFLFNNGLIY